MCIKGLSYVLKGLSYVLKGLSYVYKRIKLCVKRIKLQYVYKSYVYKPWSNENVSHRKLTCVDLWCHQ